MIYLIEGVLPEGYFANNLRGLSVDMAVFRDLLRVRLQNLSRHLDKLQTESKDSGTNKREVFLPSVFKGLRMANIDDIFDSKKKIMVNYQLENIHMHYKTNVQTVPYRYHKYFLNLYEKPFVARDINTHSVLIVKLPKIHNVFRRTLSVSEDGYFPDNINTIKVISLMKTFGKFRVLINEKCTVVPRETVFYNRTASTKIRKTIIFIKT